MKNNVVQVDSLHPPSDNDWSKINNHCRSFSGTGESAKGTYQFPYFLKVARTLYQGICEADLQDIAEDAWISFSRRSEKVDIDKPESYITTIIRNKFKDYMRKERRRSPFPTLPLSLLEEHQELEFVPHISLSLVNPVNEIDDQMETLDILQDLAFALPKVAPRQRRVIICTLLDKVDDPGKLRQMLISIHVEASEMCWPKDSAEKTLLKASLPAARRSLACLLGIDLCQFNQRKRVSHRSVC